MKVSKLLKTYKGNAAATGMGAVLLAVISQVDMDIEGVDPSVKYLVQGLIVMVVLAILALNRVATKHNADGTPDTEPFNADRK
jgi:ribose/xylose/arabinose/galactoside ABC-type transport system permease subunit